MMIAPRVTHRLEGELSEAKIKLEGALSSAATRRAFLERLPQHIQAVQEVNLQTRSYHLMGRSRFRRRAETSQAPGPSHQASKPLQAQFSMPVSDTKDRALSAHQLSHPLYVLFRQLESVGFGECECVPLKPAANNLVSSLMQRAALSG